MLRLVAFSALLWLVQSCGGPAPAEESGDETQDALPSWNEGRTKSSIVDFVSQVSNPDSHSYVSREDRVAVFDNDGTLWSEQPMYFQLFFAIDRVNHLADQHPDWLERAPFKWILNNAMDSLKHMGMSEIMALVMETHTGISTESFDKIVREWADTAKHPVTDKAYTEMVYQPMLELLDYLRDYDFQVYIVSGGGTDFMRAWVTEVYGVPSQQVIGSRVKTEFVLEEGAARIMRLPELDFIDDHQGKPIAIQRHIGKMPLIAGGNSDGDLEMLQYTASSAKPSLMLYVHHTDSVREYAYDRNSTVGRLDGGLDIALEKKWTLINMKEDWNQIFPD